MTFPYVQAEERAPAPSDAPQPAPDVKLPPVQPSSSCPGCDGSGLWRGIDGYVFVCQHCCFEMT